MENKGTQGVPARYGAELPPFISIVRYPGRPVILGMAKKIAGRTFGSVDETHILVVQKPGDHPNLRKNALGVKRPFSELSESSGVFSESLAEFEIPFSEYVDTTFYSRNTASHDLSNTKTKILGATPGAIPGIDGNPHERCSFAPAFSERFFQELGWFQRARVVDFDNKLFKQCLPYLWWGRGVIGDRSVIGTHGKGVPGRRLP